MRKWWFFWVPAAVTFGPFFIAEFACSEDLFMSISGSVRAIALTCGLAVMCRFLMHQERENENLQTRLQRLEAPG